MVKDVLRMNYFNGLFLTETEFNLEQDYHIRMRRIHNRRFFSPGIVWGLEVEKKGSDPTTTVIIREGMALNEVQDSNLEKISQEIINADDGYEIDFSTETDFQESPGTALAAGPVYICIDYLEEEDGPNQSYSNVIHRIYKKETAKIQASNTPPEDPPYEKKFIILGKVTIDVNKTITQLDLSFRDENAGPRTALASAESFDTKKLFLSIEGATGPFASIEGENLSGSNGIKVNSPKTEFSGPLTINSSFYAESAVLGTTDFRTKTAPINGLLVEGDVEFESKIGLCNTNTINEKKWHMMLDSGDGDKFKMNHYDGTNYSDPYLSIKPDDGTPDCENVVIGSDSSDKNLTIYGTYLAYGGALIIKNVDHSAVLKIDNNAINCDSELYLNYNSNGMVQIGSYNAPCGMKIFGNLEVNGTLTTTDKEGYVTDRFINQSDDTLEQGDVIVLGEKSTEIFYGMNDNIPVPEVDLTSTPYDRRVCGIVSEILVEEEPVAPYAKDVSREGIKTKAALGKKRKFDDGVKRLQIFSAKELEKVNRKIVEKRQFGHMVTIGCFAHCKVDADIAPINVGDLLTTSPTKGHAQKVLEPERSTGAIIGKALDSLKKGKGKIPVIVMMQ